MQFLATTLLRFAWVKLVFLNVPFEMIAPSIFTFEKSELLKSIFNNTSNVMAFAANIWELCKFSIFEY